MMSHADFEMMQLEACVGLRSASKCISEAILPGLGDALLGGAQPVIANRLEFCLFCMLLYNEFCWLPLEAVLLRPCIALMCWLRLNYLWCRSYSVEDDIQQSGVGSRLFNHCSGDCPQECSLGHP